MPQKKLYLSPTDKFIAGVCGGLAESFDVDSTLVRLIWALASLVSGGILGVIAYIVAYAIIPRHPES